MQLFYDPLIDAQPEAIIRLNAEESHHCVKVLRLAEGSTIALVNGRGGYYTAEIITADPKGTVLKLLTATGEFNRRNHYLHVAIAPTKNSERLEWFLEKATEIGIDEVTPIICERSERKEVKQERLHKVMVAAMKQSLKADLPKLNEPEKLGVFLAKNRADTQKFIAHCAGTARKAIKDHALQGGRYVVLIGPEGDFTAAEIGSALHAGYVPVTLGESRLRTETAALEACFELNYLNRV